jgi:hypothetical protein
LASRASLDELRENLREVVGMLLEDGEPPLDAECVGTATVRVAKLTSAACGRWERGIKRAAVLARKGFLTSGQH